MLLITNINKIMRHLFSVLLFVATLIGTSSFTYETTSTIRAENISLQTQMQMKYKGKKACKRSKARKPSVHKKRSTRSVKVGRVVYITPTGSCYHSRTSCPALWRGNYSRTSLSSARSEGYRSCSRCY